MIEVLLWWLIPAGIVMIASAIGTTVCYYDKYTWNDKTKRQYVRRWLTLFIAAPLWPVSLIVVLIVQFVKYSKYAFPRQSEE